MSLKSVLPAEIRRGAFWNSRFESTAEVTDDGGTVTGAPTFSAVDGVTLDGIADYITYNTLPNQWASTEFSCVVQFTPTFTLNDGVNHYFFDTTGNNYRFYKDSSDRLVAFLGNTVIFALALGGYSSYWNAGEANILTLAGASGDTSVWLNGTQVVVSDISAWTPTAPTELFVGIRATLGGTKFQGTIHRLLLFNKKLTDQEAEDYSNGVQWNYRDTPLMDLPMDLRRHDPAASLTLDISGGGYNGVLGAGAALPAKNTDTMGYDFDGANSTVLVAHNAVFNFTSAMTVNCWVRFDPAQKLNNTARYIVGKGDGNVDEPFILYSFYVAADGYYHVRFRVDDDTEDLIAEAATSQNSLVESWFMATGVYDAATVKVYINGVLAQSTAFAASRTMKTNADDIGIGCASDGARNLDAMIGKVKLWNTALTPLQIADLYERERLEINRV